MKKWLTTITTKDGKTYDAVYIFINFNGWNKDILLVDYKSCLIQIPLNKKAFEEFNETYIEFLNRVKFLPLYSKIKKGEKDEK